MADQERHSAWGRYARRSAKIRLYFFFFLQYRCRLAYGYANSHLLRSFYGPSIAGGRGLVADRGRRPGRLEDPRRRSDGLPGCRTWVAAQLLGYSGDSVSRGWQMVRNLALCDLILKATDIQLGDSVSRGAFDFRHPLPSEPMKGEPTWALLLPGHYAAIPLKDVVQRRGSSM